MTEFLRLRPELLGGLGRALASREYRLYAYGHIAHVHGWWGNRLGLSWLTWELTGSAAWLGIVAFANMIPVMLIAPFAGAVADRHGHRRVAIIAGSVGCVLTSTLGALALTGVMTMPLLLTLAVLQGVMFGIEFPARQALIPQLVGHGNIAAAIAFNSTTFQVGTFLGPVFAGLLITGLGAGAAILMYAVATTWMVTAISMIRHDHRPTHDRDSVGILTEIRDGLVFIAGNPSLRLLLLLTFSSGLLLRPYTELMAAFSAEVFERGAEGLAALTAAAGFGALIAALFLLYRGRTRGLVTTMLVGASLSPPLMGLFTATTEFRLALVVLAVTSMMMLATHVGAYSLIQNLAVPAMRGRIISINAAVSVGSPALGALMVGGLAEQLGLRMALATTAAVALVVAMSILPAIRRLRLEMETEPTA